MADRVSPSAAALALIRLPLVPPSAFTSKQLRDNNNTYTSRASVASTTQGAAANAITGGQSAVGGLPSGKRKADGITAFAAYSDRLLCDPTNSIYVYGKYEYKYSVTDSQSHAHVERLVRRMMKEALDQYDASVNSFLAMPEEVQHAHVLRGVPAQVLPAMQLAPRHRGSLPGAGQRASSRSRALSLTSTAVPPPQGGPAGGSDTAHHSPLSRSMLAAAAAAVEASTTSAGGVGGSPQMAATGSPGSSQSVVANISIHTVPRVTEDEAFNALRKFWPSHESVALAAEKAALEAERSPIAAKRKNRNMDTGAAGANPLGGVEKDGNARKMKNVNILVDSQAMERKREAEQLQTLTYPKVKLVIDLVVSRKSLGDSPTKSKPYRLAQYLYKHVTRRYATSVSTICIGMTDASVKLACRDVLFPFRQHATIPGIGTPSQLYGSSGGGGGMSSGNNNNNSNTMNNNNTLSGTLSYGSPRSMSIRMRSGSASFPLAATMPISTLPLCTRLPPAMPELLDQSRLFICFHRNSGEM